MTERACLDCGRPTKGRRCPEHERIYQRQHRSPSNRAASLQRHKKRRAELMAKNLPCHICGGPIAPEDFEADHLLPVSKGGEHGPLLPAHARCNRARGTGGGRNL